MTFLLTAFRWLRLKGFVLALCATLAIAWAGWQRHVIGELRDDLALSAASVAVLEAQRDAANAIAAEATKERDAAVLAEKGTPARLSAEAAARESKWGRSRKGEPDWSPACTPDSVWDKLGKDPPGACK